MSENTSDASDGDTTGSEPKAASTEFYESLTQTTDYYAAPHRVLQSLADSADFGGAGKGIPITLFLQGGMIAGHITSGQDFYRNMADLFREGVSSVTDDGELPEYADDYARRTFEGAADDIDKMIADDDKAFEEHGTKNSRWVLTRHIHLKDAYYTVPGSQSIKRDYVSVQLCQVVGWTLGVTMWG
ncbi:hypothetical protein DQP58_16330 [Mycobacterium colombiense]|uniref:Uncharacterized protein n=1 Tax=Mycobacterium colombiense TaxID=339268 RepID=A0A329KNJ5_9MYCO|nr:hypothetical protein [Mycobacterium colombiense]RAU93516.1 hypothetical protein DQP58_16330 [Mycobacterium colombiense]